jgi:K+:H+ antiporter subunit KhtU
VDAESVPGNLPLAIGLAPVTVATKLVTGWCAAGRVGADPRGQLRAGTALVVRGELSIVTAGLGVGAAVEPDLAPLAADYVLILAITGPLLTRASDALLNAARALTGRPRARAARAPGRAEEVRSPR